MRNKQFMYLTEMSSNNWTIPSPPSEEWDLNVFLQNLATDISEDELQQLKFLCMGKGGIPKMEMEKIKTAHDLFRVLREREKITEDNLLTLQSMIWHINRKPLYLRFVSFCKDQDNTLHFFVSDTEAEDGYIHVKFHVSGYKSKDREYLYQLQYSVARILRCPLEDVIVKDLIRTNSMWVTLMIPELCEEVLLNINEKQWMSLYKLDIDVIDVNGVKMHNPHGAKAIESIEKIDKSTETCEYLSEYGKLTDSTESVHLLNRSKREEMIHIPDRVDTVEVSTEMRESLSEPGMRLYLPEPRHSLDKSKRGGMIHMSDDHHPELQSVLNKIKIFEQREGRQITDRERDTYDDKRRRKESLESSVIELPSNKAVQDHTIVQPQGFGHTRVVPRLIRSQTDSGYVDNEVDEN